MNAFIRTLTRALGLMSLIGAVLFWSLSAAAAPKVVSSNLINNDGATIGTVRLEQGTKGILINVQAADLPAGYHGTHFHAVGDCSDLEAFTTAGGHVNPFDQPHGFRNPDGPHEGNLPNLVVADDGTVDVELYSDLVSLTNGPANLLDKDGSSFIVHVNQDDHFSQPIGGSGGRIACAVIQ